MEDKKNEGKITEHVTVRGRFQLVVIDGKTGKEKARIEEHNLIVNSGIALIASRLAGNSDGPAGYIAIGTGTNDPSAGDTALQNEYARKAADVSITTTNITGDTVKFYAEFSASDGLSGTVTLAEAGIFNASSGGKMLARKSYTATPIDWDADDRAQITWEIIFSAQNG